MQLKSFHLVKNLQPQTAAFLAATGSPRSVIPAAGDNVLTVDLGSSLAVEGLLDQLLTESNLSAASGLAVERQGSAFEFISTQASEAETLAKRLLKLAGIKSPGKSEINREPDVSDKQLIEKITPLHATLLNRARRGTMIAAGDSVLLIECRPALLCTKLVNQLEQQYPNSLLVDMDNRSGRIVLTGSLATLQTINQSVTEGINKTAQP